MPLEYSSLQQMQRLHPAWRLLRAEHAPLVAAFLDQAFVQPNVRTVSQGILESQLEDLLYSLRLSEGEQAFPRSAREYLEDWARNDKGWLRMFYPHASDEPHFDLTPASEKAVAWLEGLSARSFVGTESRLMTVFSLLKQMVFGAETSAEARLQELENRKREIEEEIAAVKRGEIALMDKVALQERYLQVVATARELLGDFRAVEHNFRELDQQVRERIATWEGRKGDLLHRIFGDRDQIADSDQGKSFQAFWDFLMSSKSQDEFSTMLEKIAGLEVLRDVAVDPRFRRLHYDWLDAGRQTQRTVASLSGQLRRYLENQVFLEDRRIIQIIDRIQAQAVEVREKMPTGIFTEIDDFNPEVVLPWERPLYTPKERFALQSAIQSADAAEVDAALLFQQFYIDKEKLREHILELLQSHAVVALSDVVRAYPLQHGLAELVGYIALASMDPSSKIDTESSDLFEWRGLDGRERFATLHRILFSRNIV